MTTNNKTELKIEQSTDSNIKSIKDFNHRLTLPGQREEMPSLKSPQTHGIDFCEIKGQYLAKRALEIAAAGSHHTMLIGPTGSGKTMFIKAFPSILPDNNNKKEWQRFNEKITPPFLDRFDLIAKTIQVRFDDIIDRTGFRTEKSKTIKARVTEARKTQLQRFKGSGIFFNGQMNNRAVLKYCKLDRECQELMKKALEKLFLSARGYFKTLKVSRTIADLKSCDQIQRDHVQEALQYISEEVGRRAVGS